MCYGKDYIGVKDYEIWLKKAFNWIQTVEAHTSTVVK